jgi:hypothetical protein
MPMMTHPLAIRNAAFAQLWRLVTRTFIQRQLDTPLAYNSYRYFVRQDTELLELWQDKANNSDSSIF